jgi:hypothetical protein
MTRHQSLLLTSFALTLLAAGACGRSNQGSQTPGEGAPATLESLDWKQRMAVKSAELEREEPAQYQQLKALQATRGGAGAPSLDGALVDNQADAAPVLVMRMLDGQETRANKLAIAEALPRTGGDWDEAAAALVAVEADEQIRVALVMSMRYANEPHSVTGLRHGFQDESTKVRAAAARTTGFNESGRKLYDELHSGLFADDWEFRAASAQSLGKLQMREAVSGLRRALSDANEEVRLHSLLALEKIDPEHVASFPELAPLRDDPSASVAVEAKRISAPQPG